MAERGGRGREAVPKQEPVALDSAVVHLQGGHGLEEFFTEMVPGPPTPSFSDVPTPCALAAGSSLN